jgi:tetratricopeptide (TPR) repeat protein
MESVLGLARELWRNGDRFAALGAARKAVEIAPHNAHAQAVFGAIQRQVGYTDGAVRALEAACELEPADPEMLRMLSDVYRRARRAPEALRAAKRALEVDSSLESLVCLGYAQLANDAVAEAEEAFRSTLADDGWDARGWLGYARVAGARADWRAASAALACAHEIAPTDPDVRYALAIMDLRCGRYADGYAAYPAIMDTDSDSARYVYYYQGVPRWNGDALNGRRLVIASDQGLGDHIMMARFFAALPASTPPVIVETPPALLALFRHNFPNVHFEEFTHWQPPATWDVHLPITQLPCLNGIATAADIPRAPYLRADPLQVNLWRERLGEGGNVRHVGIVWHGNRQNTRDRWRAAPLRFWEPLADVPGVRFHSLQLNADDAEFATAPFALAPTHRLLGDMNDTAALMTALDAVISVDTSTLHLAGALGRPAWLPNPLVSDYRWGIDGVDTPWYDSVRIIRQTAADDWTPVFREIAGELRAFTSREYPGR